MKPFLISFFLLLVSTANASIPSTKTIFSRIARHGGKGVYSVEQEVQFRSLAEPIALRERWLIVNGETMLMTLSSPKSSGLPPSESYRFEAVYRDGKRAAPDVSAARPSAVLRPISREFIEPVIYFRSARGLMETLVFAHILPSDFLKDRPRAIPTTGPAKYQPDPYVRLGRSNGVVTWVYGEPTPTDASKLNPEAWVEQDAFVIRRLRYPSQAEVSLDNYTTFANTLRIPRDRTVTWDNNTVTIRVLSVKALPDSAANQVNAGSITATDTKAARLPDQAIVKEFYSRFR
jgi:hypothetical protein